MRAWRRFGASAVASLAWHVVVLLFVIVVSRTTRGSHERVDPPAPSTNARVVWLDQIGPGGGGGGGGNRHVEPPRRAEAVGHDAISVPVARPRALDPPSQPRDEPTPIQQINIPATSFGAAAAPLPGTIEEASSASPYSQGPGHACGAGRGTGPGDGDGTGSGLGDGLERGTGGRFFRLGSGVTSPVEIRRAAPQYTTAAMQARVQGAVIVECVVSTSGVCTDIHVVRSLDPTYGLDQEALKAAGLWRFKPGTRFGQPVPVLVTLEITFTVR